MAEEVRERKAVDVTGGKKTIHIDLNITPEKFLAACKSVDWNKLNEDTEKSMKFGKKDAELVYTICPLPLVEAVSPYEGKAGQVCTMLLLCKYFQSANYIDHKEKYTLEYNFGGSTTTIMEEYADGTNFCVNSSGWYNVYNKPLSYTSSAEARKSDFEIDYDAAWYNTKFKDMNIVDMPKDETTYKEFVQQFSGDLMKETNRKITDIVYED